MSITPIHVNATISRVQDFTSMKQNEDQKPIIEQANISQQRAKETEEKQTKIYDADDAQHHESRYDAKEKGNGTYEQNQRKKKEQKKQNVKMAEVPRSAFDVQI